MLPEPRLQTQQRRITFTMMVVLFGWCFFTLVAAGPTHRGTLNNDDGGIWKDWEQTLAYAAVLLVLIFIKARYKDCKLRRKERKAWSQRHIPPPPPLNDDGVELGRKVTEQLRAAPIERRWSM